MDEIEVRAEGQKRTRFVPTSTVGGGGITNDALVNIVPVTTDGDGNLGASRLSDNGTRIFIGNEGIGITDHFLELQTEVNNGRSFNLYAENVSAAHFVEVNASATDNTAQLNISADNSFIRIDGVAKSISLNPFTGGAIIMLNLPTSNPAVAGQLWNDGGTLKVSAG